MELFERTGAYLQGHFRLTSGLHSPAYLQCAKVLAFPKFAEQLGRQLAGKLLPPGSEPIDLVLAPALGGLIIGHEVARTLNVPFLFTERDVATGQMTLRRGFEIRPGQKTLVIEDVITTGGSTREVVEVIRQAGAEVVAAGSIVDRSGGKADVGAPRVALEQMTVTAYDPKECPLCQQGLPVVKPGSRKSS